MPNRECNLFKKNLYGTVAALTLLSATSGCAPKDNSVAGQRADIVFRNGAVYTVDRDNPWTEAVGVAGSDIVYVGSNDGADKLVDSQTQVVDLKGKMLLPGFHDVHMHPDSILPSSCNLIGIDSLEKTLAKIAECAKSKEGEWLQGSGWWLSDHTDPALPEKLDAVTGDCPTYLVSMDGHQAWINSKAMEIAGVTAESPDPPGGVIFRDKTGKPTGILSESAMSLPAPFLPPEDPEDLMRGLQMAMRQANRYAITAIEDAWGVSPTKDRVYKEMEENGLLTTRVNLNIRVDENWDEDMDALLARKVEGSEFFRAAQIKIMTDGVMETQTAALKKPYIGLGNDKGILLFTDEQLNRWIPLLEANGFQIHAHTLGDAAVAQILTALEKSREINAKPNNRPYLIHNYLIDSADYPRIKAAEATVNFTMLWRQQDPGMVQLNKPYITEEQYEDLMPMAQVHDSGIIVTGASDWPVSQMNPLASIAVAVTGKAVPYNEGGELYSDQPVMPGKLPSLDAMIEAYTINGAYAAHMESFTGSIEIGKRADVIVLEKNLFEIPAEQIYRTQVLMTMLNGKVVFGGLDL